MLSLQVCFEAWIINWLPDLTLRPETKVQQYIQIQHEVNLFISSPTEDGKDTTEHGDWIFIMRLINKNTNNSFSHYKNHLLLVACRKERWNSRYIVLFFHYIKGTTSTL